MRLASCMPLARPYICIATHFDSQQMPAPSCRCHDERSARCFYALQELLRWQENRDRKWYFFLQEPGSVTEVSIQIWRRPPLQVGQQRFFTYNVALAIGG